MALLNCAECNNPISSKAKACTKCGAPPPRPKLESKNFVWAVVIVSVFFALFLIGKNKPSTPEEQAEANQQKLVTSAMAACRVFIDQKLNDPDSAVYGAGSLDKTAVEQKPGIWLVERKLKAKNKFNAFVKATFTCTMKYDGNNFNLIRLDKTA